ncbi:MAG: 16S rRNA (adenine(1518)-N(6)/adenine(1519)-N(6))-dimethyltransferase RsmA [Sandaracinaceae bacterium]
MSGPGGGGEGADAGDDGRAEVPGWEDPRRVLARHGLRPKRGFSQSFLVARSVVDAIVRALAAAPHERVVELGPGLGTLTGALLRAGLEVVAVERDRDMVAVLERELGAVPGLRVVAGDASTVDLAEVARRPRTAVVGNLPYAITGAILRNLVGQRAVVDRALVMVQREVRDRLVASPGTKAYGALTVFVQAAFGVEAVLRVPAGAFHPPPKVDSAVVRLRAHSEPRAVETEAFRTVVRAAFAQRRKTLGRALRATGRGIDEVEAALAAASIDGRRRGETLSVEELAELARVWSGAGARGGAGSGQPG